MKKVVSCFFLVILVASDFLFCVDYTSASVDIVLYRSDI